MSSVNKVILIGNLGRDPELRYTQGGQPVCNFSIATTERWGKGDDRKEKTEWHNVVIWGKRAEVAAEYMKKGSKVYVEGRLQTRKWQDKEGNDRYTTEIVVNDFQFLDRKTTTEDIQKLPGEPITDPIDDEDIPF